MDFKQLASDLFDDCRLTSSDKRQYRGLFGASPGVTSLIWTILSSKLPRNALPRHLLWALLFLKHYTTEVFLATFLKVDCKTVRKWTWIVIDALSNTVLFKWTDRERGNSYSEAYISVDGTDCKILEPSPSNPSLYFHKLNGPRVMYEIGLCIRNGRIFWANGPYPCGTTDLLIFRDCLRDQLERNEMVFADRECLYDKAITPRTPGIDKSFHARVRSRHETINARIKQFKVLVYPFRHSSEKHSTVFFAVLNITHLLTITSDPLFDC